MGRFCYAPWTDMVIGQLYISPCCFTGTDQNPRDVSTYPKNKQLAQFKENFLNGIEPEACFQCWETEAAGGFSRRMIINTESNHQDGNDIDYTVLENGVVDIEMNTGNICNLVCSICSSASSTKWVALEKKLQATNNEISVKFNETSAVPKRLTDSQYVQSILKYKHLKRLTLIGGEPFLGQVAEHVDLLKNLNMAHFRSLEYITNGTIMPDPLIVEQWHRIPRLEINISVDGIGDAFEYLRYPGKWQDCLRAVDFYLQVRQDHPDVELCLMTTVSVLNVMALPELMDWAMHNKIKVVLAPLVTPEYYGIRHIPENARPMIYDAWQGIEQLEPFIDFMKQHPGQTSHLADTKRYVEAMDKINNKSFNALFPAYAKLLNITT